jgi:site-specific DNA recombinase
MSISNTFRTDFDALAQDNALGNPEGELAFGYLRVSSAAQADEGRSGLPRQMMHIHEVAVENGLKIPWDYLYADDDSGFEFEDRSSLSRLRKAYKSNKHQAHSVVIEDLDRLSRNADWHQGYLLDEMKQYHLKPVFWKKFTSRVERAVMGAIAQDGMEQAKKRMAEGNIHKAKSGRVTARVPAYGYKLVDSQGREGETAKKDTHYGIYEEEALVVRFIFQRMVEGLPLRQITTILQESYPPPQKSILWRHRTIHNIVQNPAYKGEFAANRRTEIKVPVTINEGSLTGPVIKMIKRRVTRPREEWITIPVPAIVSVEKWELANEVLKKNAIMSKRNGKRSYLLTGLVHCATCGYGYSGNSKKRVLKSGEEGFTVSYRCNRYILPPAFKEKTTCDQSQISSRFLEPAIWDIVYQVLLDPKVLISALEKEFKGERNEHTTRKIAFLEKQIKASKFEDEKLYRAYLAEVFDETEFATRRKLVKEKEKKLSEELKKITKSLISPEHFEARKKAILLICNNAKENGLADNAPFEIKKNIIKTVIEKITLNVNEGWFELEGVIQGKYPIYKDGKKPFRRKARKNLVPVPNNF